MAVTAAAWLQAWPISEDTDLARHRLVGGGGEIVVTGREGSYSKTSLRCTVFEPPSPQGIVTLCVGAGT